MQATSAQRALAVLSERGLAAAVITLGSAGALLAAGKERWYAQGPRVHVVSTVGSGDSFLGGLVSALDIGRDWHEALRDAVAAGTANTLSAGAGQFTLEEFNAVRGQVQVHARGFSVLKSAVEYLVDSTTPVTSDLDTGGGQAIHFHPASARDQASLPAYPPLTP